MNPPIATQRILYAIARRAGLEPIGNNANLSPGDAREILGFMDERLREAWESYDFLETTLLEERAFADDYNPELSYKAGDIVWDWCTRLYYQALVPTAGGTVTNPAVWQSVPNVYPRMIPFWQTGKTRIGTCYSAWNKDPYTNLTRIELNFLPRLEGLSFSLSQVTATAWLQFRICYPGIALDAYDSTELYNTGDAAYYNMDTYLSLIDNNQGKQPDVNPLSWQQFRIPWVFKQFVTLAAFSDTLITSGQNEKAPDQLQQAYTALGQEYDKQTLQSGLFTGYSCRVL